MVFGFLALFTALLLLAGVVGVAALAVDPGMSHRPLLVLATLLLGLLALLAAGIGWLGIEHGHRTLVRHPQPLV